MDPFVPLTAALVEELVKSFRELRKSQGREELASDRWKSLEDAYFDHLRWRFEYPAGVFKRQAISGWLITGLVIILIVAGLVFSFIQLHYATAVGDFSSLETQAGIETAGKLSISSSIVGAVVLVISLAFFYLYLSHVFRIQYPEPPNVRLGETDILALLRERSNQTVSVQDIVKAMEAQQQAKKEETKES